ncbi:MAG: hypothetical protein WC460_06200 [Patescibacteria group bacterium]
MLKIISIELEGFESGFATLVKIETEKGEFNLPGNEVKLKFANDSDYIPCFVPENSTIVYGEKLFAREAAAFLLKMALPLQSKDNRLAKEVNTLSDNLVSAILFLKDELKIRV